MKFTIDSIEKMIEAADRERSAKEAEIASLKKQIVEQAGAAEAAADAEDLSTYMAHKKETELLEAKRYLAEKKLEKIKADFTFDNVRTAWSDFADEYTKTFDKKRNAYYKARQALYEAYCELIDLQNNALMNREKCGRLIGIVEPETNLTNDYNSVYPEFRLPLLDTSKTGKTNNWRVQSPDAVFFLEAGIASDDDMSRFNSILRLHHSY